MPLRIESLLTDLATPLSLRLVTGKAGLERQIDVPDLNRPGLALSGFLDYFPSERLQIMGKTEVTFWNSLDSKLRGRRLADILGRLKPAGFILCHGAQPPEDLLKAADAAGVAVLATPLPTTKFISELTIHLEERLAPSVTVHGSLVDVFGVGILLLGEAGIGKSECALALIDKGHRLCADDVVEIRRTPEKSLLGSGARAIRYHMEIRGLGIVDIQRLFGARAVRERKLVDLVVQLLPWEAGKRYDRTGLEDRTYTILDIPLVLHELPVQTGRNIAVLVEVAAMNWRLRQMGVNSAERLNESIMRDLRREPAPGAPPSPRRSGDRPRKRHEER